MALVEQTDSATLVIPSSVFTQSFLTDRSSPAASGVVVLIGEADGGPDYSLEDDLAVDVAFGPDQVGEVASKYISGNLVDAFRLAASPSNDPRILGAPTRILTIKTNASTKAEATLAKYDASDYGVLADKSYGKKGNLINYVLTAEDEEVIPTTGATTYIPGAGTIAYNIRVNGGTAVGGTLGANTSPVSLVSTLAGLAGVHATGGADLGVHPASGNIALSIVSGNAIQIDTTVALGATPTVGDTLVIPDGSVIEGPGGLNANVGAYVITGATSTQILATKLSDAGKPGASPGSITAPTAVGSVALSGTPANDIKAYGAVTITLDAADPLDGVGKTLEIAELTSGTDLLSRAFFVLGTTGAVTWVSQDGDPQLLESASEYRVNLTVARQLDNRSEELIAGGEIGLNIGYLGTTATVTIDDDTLTTTVTGGAGANLSIDLDDYPTIADLATYIASRPGYTAAAGTAVIGQLPPTALDDVSAKGICSTWGENTGRIKIDAYRFFNKIDQESILVQLQDDEDEVVQAASGIPAPADLAYLSGGAKGGTTAAGVVAALAALNKLRCNFVVTLFSRDASDDIADGLTESSSTYEIDAVNLALRTHVLDMSKVKVGRNRQGFASKQTTFEDARESAANLASHRMAMCFQDTRALGTDGLIHQFQPWSAAVLAAAMQAAGGHRLIVRKGVNVSGALQAEADYADDDDTDVENALLAGLLPMRRNESGLVYWVSDQTTYGGANEFLNSVQAIYVADQINLDLKIALEEAFVGESLADVSAAQIASRVDAKMGEYLDRKLIGVSDDAPKGYRNLTVKINGPTARIRVEVKAATGLYFLIVDTLFSVIKQTATG